MTTQTFVHRSASVAFLSASAAFLALVPGHSGPVVAAVPPSPPAGGDDGRMGIGFFPTCVAEVPGVPMSLCFAPGTPAEEVRDVMQRIAAQWAADLAARDAGEGGAAFELGNRWVLNGSFAQGQPVTLRWSMPADGLPIPDGITGGATSPNNLNATFASRFGSVENGKALVRQVFAKWSELSGITYQEISDDNASWGTSGGAARGDIRIAGRTFGSTGVLAYAYFPNNGDMVFVTSNANAWSSANNNRYFRNVLAHEHGHAIGMDHVCPANQTKLMEPFISTQYDGPQHDDIRGAQRHYGDRYESNDTAATATQGAILPSGSTVLLNLSIDDNSDVDWYSFQANAGSRITVSVLVSGPTSYLAGPQNADGSCSAGTTQSPRVVQDMTLGVYRGTGGAITVATANATTAGNNETLTDLLLPATDTYYVKVGTVSTTDSVQLYGLQTNVTQAPARPGDFDNDGTVGGADLSILLAVWGAVTCGSPYDIAGGDCTVNGSDLSTLLANWG